MQRTRSEAETLSANRDGWGIDGLSIDAVFFEEAIGVVLAEVRIADDDRDDMRLCGEDGNARVVELGLEQLDVLLLQLTFGGRRAEIANRGESAGRKNRRQ